MQTAMPHSYSINKLASASPTVVTRENVLCSGNSSDSYIIYQLFRTGFGSPTPIIPKMFTWPLRISYATINEWVPLMFSNSCKFV